MSKWRPAKDKCIYVIPDIHGNVQLLDLVLDRILPLRKNDQIVFLGDYVDRGTQSEENIHYLLKTKLERPEEIYLLASAQMPQTLELERCLYHQRIQSW